MFPRIDLKWTVGPSDSKDGAVQKRVPAQVPGAVQLDWARDQGWGEHWYADNWKQYDGLEDRFWSYKAAINVPPLAADQRLVFVCKGVDYRFQVRLGNAVLHDQEGMFTPFEIDLTGRVKNGDELEVLVFPAPKSVPTPHDRTQANQSCKPAVAYGWDFHARLIPLGIWDETYLEVRPALHIRDAETSYCLSDDFSKATLVMEADLSQACGSSITWTVTDPDGKTVGQQTLTSSGTRASGTMEIANPRLWWPNGQGEQALYTSSVMLAAAGSTVQTVSAKVGLRRVRLVMAPGQWDRPADFPKTRSEPPITMEINGRSIFCKGSNWVAPDIFVGTITRELYRTQLDLVQGANMNIVRCWGGAIVNKEAFFELCDERGIMVWQEFPLACNRYEGTPGYLKAIDQESRSIIRRLRRHASVCLWCAGNELFNVWSGMTDQDAAIRLLNRNCYDLSPDRPFLPTSPVMGMGHGHYVFRHKDGRECFEIFQTAANTAYTEFGNGGPCSAEELRRFIPADQLFPALPGTAWETHHAFKAWEPNSHLLLDVMVSYFGEPKTLEELVANCQLMQQQGLKGIFEEGRRQKPRASMTLNWVFNEPWPCAGNLSLVSWWNKPKAAYYGVKDSLRPVLASARIPKFRWHEDEQFHCEMWLLNDSPAAVPAGRMEAVLKFDDGSEEIVLLGWDFHAQRANANLHGPTVRFTLPHRVKASRMQLMLRVVGQPELDSEYTLLYVPKEAPQESGTRALNQ